jgi:predicted transcriptional regulator
MYLFEDIDNGNLFSVLVLFTNTFTGKSPDLVKVDNGTPVGVVLQVEVTHTDLTKVTRMVLIHVDTVMMLTTSKTTTTRMLSVLADTTVTG